MPDIRQIECYQTTLKTSPESKTILSTIKNLSIFILIWGNELIFLRLA
jgi:hypothetical protein